MACIGTADVAMAFCAQVSNLLATRIGLCSYGLHSYGRYMAFCVQVSNLLATRIGSSGADFLRHNQYPDLVNATPDEGLRIEADKSRFGGTLDADGNPAYGEADSVFIVEIFERRSGRRLLTPEEWMADWPGGTPPAFCVVAFDLNGHFSAGFTFSNPALGASPHGARTRVHVRSYASGAPARMWRWWRACTHTHAWGRTGVGVREYDGRQLLGQA